MTCFAARLGVCKSSYCARPGLLVLWAYVQSHFIYAHAILIFLGVHNYKSHHTPAPFTISGRGRLQVSPYARAMLNPWAWTTTTLTIRPRAVNVWASQKSQVYIHPHTINSWALQKNKSTYAHAPPSKPCNRSQVKLAGAVLTDKPQFNSF